MEEFHQNFNYGTRATLTIKNIPDLVFYVQDYAVPGVRLNSIVYPTYLVALNVPATHLQFEPLTITYIMSEKLKEYTEIFAWMKRLAPINDGREYSAVDGFSDGMLTIYSNQQNPILRIKLIDLFPTDLTSLYYSASEDASIPKTHSVTFAIRNFELEAV